MSVHSRIGLCFGIAVSDQTESFELLDSITKVSYVSTTLKSIRKGDEFKKVLVQTILWIFRTFQKRKIGKMKKKYNSIVILVLAFCSATALSGFAKDLTYNYAIHSKLEGAERMKVADQLIQVDSKIKKTTRILTKFLWRQTAT